MEPEDFELARKWAGGDETAGAALVERYFDTVHRFFVTKLDRGCDDLVQKTFLGCTEGIVRIEKPGSFKAFLLGIARRQLFLHYRQGSNDRREVGLHESLVPDAEARPSSVIAQSEEQRLLLSALRRLPLEHQTIVGLFYWEELSTAEVGQVMEMPAGTVKHRLWHARQQLRQEIAKLAESDDLRRSTLDNFDRWVASIRARAR